MPAAVAFKFRGKEAEAAARLAEAEAAAARACAPEENREEASAGAKDQAEAAAAAPTREAAAPGSPPVPRTPPQAPAAAEAAAAAALAALAAAPAGAAAEAVVELSAPAAAAAAAGAKAEADAVLQLAALPFLARLRLLLRSLDVWLFLWQALLQGYALGLYQSYLFMTLGSMGASTALMGLTITVDCLAEFPAFWFKEQVRPCGRAAFTATARCGPRHAMPRCSAHELSFHSHPGAALSVGRRAAQRLHRRLCPAPRPLRAAAPRALPLAGAAHPAAARPHIRVGLGRGHDQGQAPRAAGAAGDDAGGRARGWMGGFPAPLERTPTQRTPHVSATAHPNPVPASLNLRPRRASSRVPTSASAPASAASSAAGCWRRWARPRCGGSPRCQSSWAGCCMAWSAPPRAPRATGRRRTARAAVAPAAAAVARARARPQRSRRRARRSARTRPRPARSLARRRLLFACSASSAPPAMSTVVR
jgi:hypothetical protein